MIQIVILWTDGLFFALMCVAVLALLWILQHEHLRRPWREVVLSKRGLVSSMMLLTFVLIALLDSMHYREALPKAFAHQQTTHFSPHIYSVLDTLLDPIGRSSEKTYSAPFALVSFVKESRTLDSGVTERYFPRLQYINEKITAADQSHHIALLAIQGLLHALGYWLCCFMILSILAIRRAQQQGAKWWFYLLHRRFWLGVGMLAVILLVICCVMSLAQHYHVMGTDKIGEDVFYQAVKSIRTGLIIGTVTTLVMLPLALLLGALAGYFGGFVDDVIQYFYTTLSSIPGVLLIAAAILMLQVSMSKHPEWFASVAERGDARLLALCLILGLTSWTSLCRLIRAEVMKIKALDYIMAARAMGVSHPVIILRHLIPNVMHLVFIILALDFSGLVLAEAVLSYVGVGVDPTTQSWGNMINQARLELAREPAVWWSLVGSFVFMFSLVLCANLFADVVRDAFDPRLSA